MGLFRKRKFLIFLGRGGFCLSLFLNELSYARQDIVPGSRYTSARAAGLGDAYISLGDDAPSGLFYNPASLGRIRKFVVEPINFSVSANSGFVKIADPNAYKVTDLSSYAPVVNQHSGQRSGMGGGLVSSLAFPGFALGVLAETHVSALGNGDNTLNYQSLYQLIPAFGSGFRFFQGIIRVGYSLQWVNQAQGNQTVSVDGDLGYNQNLKQGSGLSHTLGLALTLPVRYLPMFDVVVRNVMNTSYQFPSLYSFTQSSTGFPDSEPMTVDVAFSLHPRLGRGVLMNLILQERDMTNRSGIGFLFHFAAGMELSFRDKVFLRGGWRGGYFSAGLGLKGRGAEMSLALFTENVGTSSQKQGDTSCLFQYQIRTY